MGYRVLVAEGSPIVMKIILSGYIDAIVGVACLNVLEKAIDKVLLAGIPCIAVPLLSSNCKATSVDEDRVREMLLLQQTEPVQRHDHLRAHHAGRVGDVRAGTSSNDWCRGLRGGPRLSEVNGQGICGGRADRRDRSDCLRLPGQGRQVLAPLHHAGRATTR